MGLTFQLTKPEQTFDLITLKRGQTARLKNSPSIIVYCAEQGLVVSLSNSHGLWHWSHLTAPQDLPRESVIPTVFDAQVTKMPVAIWTENFTLTPLSEMQNGQFGILCDESPWHGAMIFKHEAGLVHLSKSGSRRSRHDTKGSIQLVNLLLTEKE